MPKRVDVELPIKRAEPGVAGMWWLSLGLAGAVVGVVAALLGAIVQTARKIDEHAAAIWMVEKTNEQASKMVESLRRIEQSAASIDEKLATLARSDGRRSGP